MKIDYKIIFDIVETGSKVLDLGTGNGDLLSILVNRKDIKAQGIEIAEKYIYECVEKGLSVFHSDFEGSMQSFPDSSFDYVILNHSMQEAKQLVPVINEALRVGKKVIIGFPNFAFIKGRLRLLIRGKVPVTKSLPFSWFDTPNLRFLSISDFADFCREKNLKIEKAFYYGKNKKVNFLPNLFAYGAIFVISK